MKPTAKRSPIKAKPLRVPGQSLDEQIAEIWDDIMIYGMYGVTFFGFTLLEWMHYLGDATPHPWTYTIVTLLLLAVLIYKGINSQRKIEQLRLARDGERAVGQYLDELRKDGARVLHDILGDKFNVDHVIISPKGIFVVDTKTYRKPLRGDAIVKVNGDHVLVNGFEIDRNPIDQVKALSKWVQNLLEETTGKKFPVRPVVLFPGWYVERMKPGSPVWVLNPKALPTFIAKEKNILLEEDVRLATYHLARYIRTKP